MGPGPLCLTPRKSIMRCPPTPQRTPTWDGLEDSLLLEGAGSGGRVCGNESAGMSSRHSLRQSKLLASGGAGAGAGAGAGRGMAIDAGLANASGDPFNDSILSAAGDGFGSSRGGSGGGGDGDDDGGRGLEGTGGRGGRGRGGRERSSFGGSSAGGRSGRGDAAKQAASAGAGGAGGGRAAGAGPGGAEDTLGFKHDFVQMGPIGEGGFSVVWKVRARGTGRLYAIKRSKREFRGRKDRDRCLLEARALQRLGEHPGVLRFERAWQEEGHFCLQTELCELGTLKDFLERVRKGGRGGRRGGGAVALYGGVGVSVVLFWFIVCRRETRVCCAVPRVWSLLTVSTLWSLKVHAFRLRAESHWVVFRYSSIVCDDRQVSIFLLL